MEIKNEVLTCIHDARKAGGGVAGVANSVHSGLIKNGINALMLCAFSPQDEFKICQNIETSAKNISHFFKSKNIGKIVHVHGLWTPFVWKACIAAKKNDIPLIISPHGMLEEWAMNHKFWRKKLAWKLYQKRILMNAELLIVNSQRELETVRNLGLKNPVGVIENGVDATCSEITILPEKREKIVLFLSRLSPVKGIPDLIQAWADLPPGHGYELKIYGNSDLGYKSKIEQLIKKFRVGGTVKLMGPIFGVDKWRLYKKSSFFVLPSYSENFGIVVAEALLAGLPVVTTRATPWECLEKEGIGLQIDNDPQQLSAAISMMMAKSEQERDQVSELARTYAQKRFLWPKIINKYLRTYEWLLNPSLPSPKWIDFVE